LAAFAVSYAALPLLCAPHSSGLPLARERTAGVNVFHNQGHGAAGEIEPQVVACDQSRGLRQSQ